jgi:hypothetical protein
MSRPRRRSGGIARILIGATEVGPSQRNRSLTPLEDVLLESDIPTRELVIKSIFVKIADHVNRTVEPVVREAERKKLGRSRDRRSR